MKYLFVFSVAVLFISFKGQTQENALFKESLMKAWEQHTQKQYDSAMANYVKAFSNYSATELENRILPEYKSVAKQLSGIFKKDQSIRTKYLKKSYPQGSKKRAALIEEMNTIDAENLKAVEGIIAEYGWLGPDQAGYFGNKAFFLILQHAELDKQLRYFDHTVDAVAKGYMEPYQLAYLIDRISLREKRLLAFGSECRQYPNSQSYYVAPTFGISTLDERRAMIGLAPMASYVTKYDIIWDPGAYTSNLPKLLEQLGF